MLLSSAEQESEDNAVQIPIPSQFVAYSCMLHLDSLKIHPSKTIEEHILAILYHTWVETKTTDDLHCNTIMDTVPLSKMTEFAHRIAYMQVPGQKNNTDCGVFTANYADEFVTNIQKLLNRRESTVVTQQMYDARKWGWLNNDWFKKFRVTRPDTHLGISMRASLTHRLDTLRNEYNAAVAQEKKKSEVSSLNSSVATMNNSGGGSGGSSTSSGVAQVGGMQVNSTQVNNAGSSSSGVAQVGGMQVNSTQVNNAGSSRSGVAQVSSMQVSSTHANSTKSDSTKSDSTKSDSTKSESTKSESNNHKRRRSTSQSGDNNDHNESSNVKLSNESGAESHNELSSALSLKKTDDRPCVKALDIITVTFKDETPKKCQVRVDVDGKFCVFALDRSYKQEFLLEDAESWSHAQKTKTKTTKTKTTTTKTKKQKTMIEVNPTTRSKPQIKPTNKRKRESEEEATRKTVLDAMNANSNSIWTLQSVSIFFVALDYTVRT